jgi:hypothetical protein
VGWVDTVRLTSTQESSLVIVTDLKSAQQDVKTRSRERDHFLRCGRQRARIISEAAPSARFRVLVVLPIYRGRIGPPLSLLDLADSPVNSSLTSSAK